MTDTAPSLTAVVDRLSLRVVGLDLSLTSTGIAVVDDSRTQLHRIQTTGSKTATLAQRGQRLAGLAQRVLRLAWLADLVVVEGPSFGSRAGQGAQHDRAGLWWLTVDRLHARGVPVVEVPPSCRAKYASGRGNAGKDEVLAAVVRRYPDVEVTGNDTADALILAAMGARALGRPIEDSLPAAHLDAMAKVAWPGEVTAA